MQDPVKQKERKKRYLQKIRALKYGPEAAEMDMRGRHGNHARGSANGKWNGEGYIAIAVPVGHHLRMANGYAYVHQIEAEKKLGRRLNENEVVHHKDGNRTNNSHDNLEVLLQKEHASIHSYHPGARDELGRFNTAKRSGDKTEERR